MPQVDTVPQVDLVASLTTPLAEVGRELASVGRAAPGATWLEVRADEVGDIPVEALREAFAGKLLYTLRSRSEGGAFQGSPEQRYRRLATAAADYDRVDLEAAQDLVPQVLEAVAPGQRVVSWHGGPADLPALEKRFQRMAEVEAALYKLVPKATRAGQEIAPLRLLKSLGRDDVVAFALGRLGTWSRLAALALGAPWIYGALGDRPAAPGQLPLRALIEDYGLPRRPALGSRGNLYGIVGNPVSHSLSPRIHNGAYRELNLVGLFVPFQADSFSDFWLEVVESPWLSQLGFHLAGLSVTAPFKSVGLAVAGASSPIAQRVGGANTLVRREGVWEAETTDPAGVILPLRSRGIDPQGLSAAVVGCGGAGRASAAGLALAGAEVTLVNRSEARGRTAAEELGLSFVPLKDFDPGAFRIVVHATSLGRGGKSEPLPFDPAALPSGAALVDLVYADGPTPLVDAATRADLTILDGREVLLAQALEQFRAMTGREMPIPSARRRLGLGPAPGSDAKNPST